MPNTKLVTRSGICGQHLLTTAFIAKGEVIFNFCNAQRLDYPTYQTIQVNIHQHVIEDSLFLFLNHSCHPNVFVDTVLFNIYALEDIQAEEELAFFYPATEWQMTEPFHCHCGAKDCLGLISGAAHLSNSQLSRYKVNPHIWQLFEKQQTG